MIDGSENVNRWLRFEFQSSHAIENRNNVTNTIQFLSCFQPDDLKGSLKVPRQLRRPSFYVRTLSSTNQPILPPKRNDEHPRLSIIRYPK